MPTMKENKIFTVLCLAFTVCTLLFLCAGLFCVHPAVGWYIEHTGRPEVIISDLVRAYYFCAPTAIIGLALMCKLLLNILSNYIFEKENAYILRIICWCALISTAMWFVSVFSLVLIATALSKMLLYIRFYGMSYLRLVPSVFMVVLAVCFVPAIIRTFRPNFAYMKILTVFCAAVMIVISFADLGSITANYNMNAYLDKDCAWRLNNIDIHYLE